MERISTVAWEVSLDDVPQFCAADFSDYVRGVIIFKVESIPVAEVRESYSKDMGSQLTAYDIIDGWL